MAKVDRREFLVLVGTGGLGVGAGVLLGESMKKPREYLVPYTVPPEEYSPGIDTWYNTLCQGCDARCGISVRVREGRVKKIEGNPAHPVNQGAICARGQSGVQDLYHPDRVQQPLSRQAGSHQPIGWDQALDQISTHLQGLGADQKAYLISGSRRGHLDQLLRAFAAQHGAMEVIDYRFDDAHNLRAAHRHCFGNDQLPRYDIEHAALLVSFGADFLANWLSPVYYMGAFGRMRQGHQQRGRFVQVEPRMSQTGANADQWLAARPGSEGVLALALARNLVRRGDYQGADAAEWEQVLEAYAPDQIADECGLEAAVIKDLGRQFASGPGLAIIGGAAAQGSNGFFNAVAVNALNHLAGNLGRAGGVLTNPEPLFGVSPGSEQSSYGAMIELTRAAAEGDVGALIVHDADPLFSLPASSGFAAALESIPLVVSLTSILNDTAAKAHLVLPIHSFLEDWDDAANAAEIGARTASIAQPVVRPLYDSRSTGDILLQLASRMGGELSEDLSASSAEAFIKQRWQGIYDSRYSAGQGDFESFWQATLQAGVYGEQAAAPEQAPPSMSVQNLADAGSSSARFDGDANEFPLQLHPFLSPTLADGRWAHLPWLQELPDPTTSVVYGSWVELNPVTAKDAGLSDGDLVRLQSSAGELTVPVVIYPGIRPDVLAMPIGQGHAESGRYAKGRGVNPMRILAAATDEFTGDLAWAATRVKMTATGERIKLAMTGFKPRTLGRQILGPADSEHG